MARGRLSWIEALSEIQEEILLIYHPTRESTWTDRCMYLDDNFDQMKKYNHRGILKNEIVMEFDLPDRKENKRLINEVSKRLKEDYIKHVIWSSGNKSYHCHCFVDPKEAQDLPMLKRVFMRHYTEGLSTLPDLQLCSNNHPIRAEYGKHEKTGEIKKLIKNDPDYPVISTIPDNVWDKYLKLKKRSIQASTKVQLNNLAIHPAVQFLCTAENMRNIGDGRERVMFLLINILGHKYIDREDEFVQYLCDWYRYSSGIKLKDRDVRSKIKNWMNGKRYVISIRKIRETFEELQLEWKW